MAVVSGRRVVITGKVPGHTRGTAQAFLRDLGAIIQEEIGAETDVLVTGERVGPKKIEAAQKAKDKIEIVPWAEAIRNSGAAGTRPTPPPRAPLPNVRQWLPMLCLSGALPTGSGWIHEIKFDGVRAVVTAKDGLVAIWSRSGKTDYTKDYPDIAEELSRGPNCVLDGEIVSMGDELGLLGEGSDSTPIPRFIAFDILEDDGDSLIALPLHNRRVILELRVAGGQYVAPSPIFTDTEKLLAFVTEHRLEGIVSKLGSSRYIENGRGSEWIKFKVRPSQEFVVIGYTPGTGSRASTFGALVLGVYDGDDLVYSGKVGTGFNAATLRDLTARLAAIPKLNAPSLSGAIKNVEVGDNRDVIWLEPVLVVRVQFQKWTPDDVIYHSSYQGLDREGKAPRDVVRET